MESKCPYKPVIGDVEDCQGRRPAMVSNMTKCCWQRGSYRSFPCFALLSFLLLAASVGVLLFTATGMPTNSRRLIIEVDGDSGDERDTATIGGNAGDSDADVWHKVMGLVEGNLKETGTFLVKKETNGTLPRLLQLLKARIIRGTQGSDVEDKSGNNIGNLNVFSINVINSNNNNDNNDNDDDTTESDNNVKNAKNRIHVARNNVLNVVRSFDGDKVGNDDNNGNNNDDDNIINSGRKSVSNATAEAEETAATADMTGANGE